MPLSPDWFESIREEAGAENMKAPTEEQLREPAWWTLNAPSGCEKVGVAYIDGKVWSYEFMMPGVTAMTSPCNAEVRFFSRPTKPEPTKEERLDQHIAERDAFLAEDELQSQEWDEAGEFPPVDSKVLANVAGEWKPIVICGYGNRFCLGLDEDGADVCFPFNDDSFRPIRTEAEKQREEVLAKALPIFEQNGLLGLYDAGMLCKADA